MKPYQEQTFDFEKKEPSWRYNKGWVPGPDAMWQKVNQTHPDDMAKSLNAPKEHKAENKPASQEKTHISTPAPNEQVSSRKPTQLAPSSAPKTQLAPSAMKSPDELAASFKKAPNELVANRGPEQVATSAEVNKSLAGPAISPEEARSLFESLPKDASTGLPLSAVMAANKLAKRGTAQWDTLAQDAATQIYMAALKVKAGTEGEFAKQTNTIAQNILRNQHRDENAPIRGGGKVGSLGEIDVAGKPQGESIDAEAFDRAIGHLNPMAQKIARLKMEGHSLDKIAEETGMERSKVRRTIKAMADVFKEFNENEGPKDRYVIGPILPDVWTEILRQSTQYGPRAPDFVSAVMNAMKDSNGQWEAIIAGRRDFLSGRYEYGPRHQPPKRIEGAVNRLEALRDYCDDIDYDDLLSEVDGIAREFSADELKIIARECGIEGGLTTKANVVRLLCEHICKKKKKGAA